MAERFEDLILHPIRMRLLVALAAESPLTPQQLAERLPDVPPATLYRHINKLASGGILAVADQRQVRGAQEKAYALADNRFLRANAGGDLTSEELMQLFTTFVATLLGGAGRYLQQERFDPAADGLMFRQAAVFMNDQEFQRYIAKLRELQPEFMGLPPGEGRRQRTIATIIIPEPNEKPKEREPSD